MSLPVFNDANRDAQIEALSDSLSERFNLPHLYMAHHLRQDDKGAQALFVYICDLAQAHQKVPYEVFFETYNQLRHAYQHQVALYVRATHPKEWDIPPITPQSHPKPPQK